MTPLEIAPFLKEYGPWALLGFTLLAIWWLQNRREDDRTAATARYDALAAEFRSTQNALLDRLAVTIERNNATNAAVTAALESRVGIFERLHSAVEEAKAETRALINDLKNHGVTNDEWTREKLGEAMDRMDKILDSINVLRREAGR